MKNRIILVLSLVFILFFLQFASACHCGDGIVNRPTEQCDRGALNGFLCWAGYGSSCDYCSNTCKLKTITNYCGDGIKQECEECDDGNTVSDDGCSSLCKIEEPEEPTCTHDVAVRYSYSNSFGTGIAVGYENGIWIEGNPVNLEEGNYKIKYYIDNKEEADDNVHIIVKVDSGILLEESKLIDSYSSKTINLDVSQLCGTHTISVEIESDGDECNLEDNYASREIYVDCNIEPPAPVCGNNILEESEQCDDGNSVNGDGCSSTCQLEQNPPEPYCGDGIKQECEECDDGNNVNGDGCSNICKTEENDDEDKVSKTTEFVQYCDTNWKCTGWGGCSNNVMTRNCIDKNHCDVEYNKPLEQTDCNSLSKVYVEKENNGKYFWILFGIVLFIILVIIIINLLKPHFS
ncbi:MAG: DUF4215 domain-containing protein [Candidatus Diapherotrites archaeon]